MHVRSYQSWLVKVRLSGHAARGYHGLGGSVHNREQTKSTLDSSPLGLDSISRMPPRVLLLEDDNDLASTLLEFFELEGFSTIRCDSFAELKDRIRLDPTCVIVTDSWVRSAETKLSPEQREQILDLDQMAAGVILTTGRAWAKHVDADFSTCVVVLEKPYELDTLRGVIHQAWGRASNNRS